MTDNIDDQSQGDRLRPFKELMSHEQALETILNEAQPLERTEVIDLTDALGRIVINPVKAEFNVPGFKRATMDGYAVLAEDTFGAEHSNPKILNCIGTVYAGEVPGNNIVHGTCIKIATGAILPDGADAVVKVEDTNVKDTPEQVAINIPVYPLQNVGKEDEDIASGEVIIKEGDVLTPSKVGVIAALGRQEIEVYAKPKVGIIPTGNEVVPVGSELKKGQVYDINSYTLASITIQNGGIPKKFGIAGDTEEELERMIVSAVEECDMVLLSGGSSVGERDLLVDVFLKMGNVLFHGIQVKPGKPTLCGIINGKMVFGMPGYPTSCLSNGYIFIRPALRKIARLPPLREQTVRAKLSQRIASNIGRHHFMTVKLEGTYEDAVAVPIFKKSGAITSMATADGYIEIGSNVDILEAGEYVEVKLL